MVKYNYNIEISSKSLSSIGDSVGKLAALQSKSAKIATYDDDSDDAGVHFADAILTMNTLVSKLEDRLDSTLESIKNSIGASSPSSDNLQNTMDEVRALVLVLLGSNATMDTAHQLSERYDKYRDMKGESLTDLSLITTEFYKQFEEQLKMELIDSKDALFREQRKKPFQIGKTEGNILNYEGGVYEMGEALNAQGIGNADDLALFFDRDLANSIYKSFDAALSTDAGNYSAHKIGATGSPVESLVNDMVTQIELLRKIGTKKGVVSGMTSDESKGQRSVLTRFQNQLKELDEVGAIELGISRLTENIRTEVEDLLKGEAFKDPDIKNALVDFLTEGVQNDLKTLVSDEMQDLSFPRHELTGDKINKHLTSLIKNVPKQSIDNIAAAKEAIRKVAESSKYSPDVTEVNKNLLDFSLEENDVADLKALLTAHLKSKGYDDVRSEKIADYININRPRAEKAVEDELMKEGMQALFASSGLEFLKMLTTGKFGEPLNRKKSEVSFDKLLNKPAHVAVTEGIDELEGSGSPITTGASNMINDKILEAITESKNNIKELLTEGFESVYMEFDRNATSRGSDFLDLDNNQKTTHRMLDVLQQQPGTPAVPGGLKPKGGRQ